MTVAQLGIQVDSAQAAKGAVNLDALAASAAKAEAATSNLGSKATTAIKSTSLQTANLAAQLNDIAVQLQSGQSPFQIALQQGTQINQVIGQHGAKDAVAALGTAFTSLINPVSLATIGIITLGGAAIQYLGTFTGGAAAAAERALERQKSLIDDITLSSSQAGKELKAWLAIGHSSTPNEIIVATRAQIKAASNDLASLSAQLDNLISNRGGGRSGASNPLAFQPELLATITEAVHQFENGAITASTLKDRLAELQLDPKLTETTKALVQGFSDVADKIGLADATAHAFSSALDKLSSFDIVGSDFSALVGVGNSVVDQLRQMAPDLRTPKQKATDTYTQNSALDFDGSIKKQLDYTLKQIDAQKALQDSEAATRKAQAAAEAHATAVKSVTASLNDQLAALTETDREQFISKELSAAKADAATEEGRAIADLAGQYYDQKQAVDALNATLKDIDDTGRSLTEGFFSTFKQDLKDGKTLWESFGDAASGVLDSLAEQALKMAADGIWNMIFGAVTGAVLGGGVGARLGRTVAPSTFDFGAFLTGHAAGTPSAPPGLAWVGEQGPELMRFRGGEQVYSNRQSMAMAANGNAANQNIVIEVQVSVDDNGKLVAIARQAGGQAAQVIITQTVPGMIKSQAPAAVASSQRNRTI